MAESTTNQPLARHYGSALTAVDHAALLARWITPDIAVAAGLSRVDSITGREMFARRRGDCSGIVIPNILPGETSVREYRLRLDNPELDRRSDGTLREMNKYLQPPNRPNLIYFPPGLPVSVLSERDVPIIITEGEFKALSLWRLAHYKSELIRFVPLAIAGVWNFRGSVGKTTDANGRPRPVKGMLPDFNRLKLKDRRVMIAFDADVATNPKVQTARTQLSVALIELGATVGQLEWQIDEGKGIDDWVANVGPDRVLAEIDAVRYGDWRTRLLRNDFGRLRACYENAALLLENSPEWAGVIGFNEFTSAHVILAPPPTPLTALPGAEIEDHFDTELVRWLERQGVMVKPEVGRRVVDAIGRQNSFHPVRNHLESLPDWDGVPRLRTWLPDYLGVESSDNAPNLYAEAIGEKILISAVARVYAPGCKVDTVPVLEGKQGIGKSTAWRVLAGDEFFIDQMGELGSKDASMQLRGRWFIELAELGALNRAEQSRAKAFFSQQTERFRLPYGRRICEYPRQCIFVGTTNIDAWLTDETGGRRYWPIRCRWVDLDALRRDRDQLFAEALYLYRGGAKWWLDEEETVREAMREQADRYVPDVWHPKIAAYVQKRESVTIAEILEQIGIDTAKQDQRAMNRVQRCLRFENWQRRRCRSGSLLEWRYLPPGRDI